MNQQSQTNLLIGIGAISAAVIAGYFGLDYLTGSKQAAEPKNISAAANGDYSAAIASATESALTNTTNGASLTADEARRIGEEVARQVATQVAESVVGQSGSNGDQVASSGQAGLSEADARRIGEEEGRRVAQEVATAAIEQALAEMAAQSGQNTLTAEQAEQIGIAAGLKAARRVAASTAREVVQNEFGGQVAASAGASEYEPADTADSAASTPVIASKKSAPPQHSSASVDAMSPWWTTPSGSDFGLVYAGQPKGETAIALLFSAKPSEGTLDQNIRVYDEKGSLVSGSWEAAANPRMAVLRGLQPGRYTVVVAPTLAGSSGQAVSKGQHGPVYVI